MCIVLYTTTIANKTKRRGTRVGYATAAWYLHYNVLEILRFKPACWVKHEGRIRDEKGVKGESILRVYIQHVRDKFLRFTA